MGTDVVIEGIRVNPPVVEFQDINADVVYQTQITIQNFGKVSRRIRFQAPPSEKFQLHCKNQDRVIAPGLEVSALVEFCSQQQEDHDSKILLLVDEEIIEVPLIALAPKPAMEITGPVDFGTVIADGRILRQEIAILNRGSKNGAFKLSYGGKEQITIVPRQGIVKAGYSQPIRFEFISKKPGLLDEAISVMMEGQAPCEVRVIADIAKRSLLLLSMENEEKVDHVDFGHTYYGTDVLRSCVLFNQSPDPVSFVVILEEDGEGQELGVDLSVTKSAAFLDTSKTKLKYEENDLTSLVTASPTQGTLAPYDKRLLHFKFSPRFSKSDQGWFTTDKSEPRRDYAVFVHIDIVGNIIKLGGKTTPTEANESRVEVALTGTALPVSLSILPSPTIEFDNCPVGSSLDCKVTIRNDSPDLPVAFAVPKSAHFVPFPQADCLDPNGFMELLISFRPNQIGNFKPKMNIVVLGYSVEIGGDFSSLPKFKQKAIFKYPLQVRGVSLPVVGKKTAKSLSAQGRLFPQDENDSSTNLVLSGLGTSLKVFCSDDTNAGMMRSKASGVSSGKDCKKTPRDFPVTMARPDDLAASIRPSNKKEKVLTQFTKTERYTYVDPDYEYSFEEDEERRMHRQKYVDYIQKLRKQKIERDKALELKNLDNPVDIGMKSHSGLQPTKIKIEDAKPKGRKEGNKINVSKPEKQLLTSKSLQSLQRAAATKKVADGLKALPTTAAEKSDCSKALSPKELYQIVLEPKVIDFGEICAKSLASKKMKIANSLSSHIHIKAEIDCRELRQTSPLSQVVPPGCVAALEFVFESNNLGKFERSVSYTINGQHKAHVIVLAEVVTVALSLSTQEITVSPSPGLPPEAGMRKTLTLHNNRNMTAEFSWAPVVGKDGTAFSVRPARGTVNPNSSLECEVVFYPSYFAPLTGLFHLNVEGGNQLELHTEAEIPQTSCSFVEHRVMFGAVPLNLVTTRSAFLKNTSQNHAYFKVVDPSPIHGMTITPRTGVVPVGGTAELLVSYKPLSVQKFDTQIEVAVRGWKPIFLRLGGHVEPPCVDIDLESFQFGGIYCGAKAVIPFKLKNLARSRAKIAFDLSRQRDFLLTFGEFGDAGQEIPDAEGCFEVGLIGQQELQCFLEFNPVEVASYDFIIPAVINQTIAPTPPPSPYPASVAMSKPGHVSEDFDGYESKRVAQFPTPSRRVQGTALRAPLQVSSTEINFHLPSGYLEMGIETSAGRAAGIMFVNNSSANLVWCLNIENAGPYFEDGTFQLLHRTGSPFQLTREGRSLSFPETAMYSGETSQLGILFAPREPGIYEASIPVIMNGDIEHPYRMIHLHGELEAPSISFDPTAIHFFPTPLRTKATMDFYLIAKGYRRVVTVKCIVPEVELEDGSELRVLDVTFPDGNIIQPCCQDFGEKEPFKMLCRISFESPKPVSFSTAIEFVTDQDRHPLHVMATADNCILSCYKFLATHQTDFHIICEELPGKGKGVPGIASKKEGIAYGDAMLVPCVSAIKSPTENSNITTSTSFGLSVSTYPESSMSSSTARSPTDDNKEEEHEETTIPYEYCGTEDTAETEEEKYLKDVMKSVQRWYSSQAWSSGPSPIILPHSLRSCFGPGLDDGGTTRAGIWSREKKKENKTVFDIVTHLCGKAIPGIPINASVPTEPFERTKHLHWMYATLLTFLRCQGAMVASILPEYLLDKEDFKRLVLMRNSEMSSAGVRFSARSLQREQEKYETLSKHSWTDLLLQIIKVLVLNRITPQQYRKIALPSKDSLLPVLNADPLSSNVFGVGERIILSWVNYHYQQQRSAGLWKTSVDGKTPSSRWIVNFENDFLDGLVLASLIAAHTPFIIPKFFASMYTHPLTAEQCLHNALKVVEAIRYLGMDYDAVATDITEPNPISMLMLCIYLYHRLPHYIPRSKVEFTGPLHSDVTKQVKLQNPSTKPIVYQVIIAGDHAADFNVPSGRTIKVPPKGQVQLPIEYRSRFLRSCSAVLILVGRRVGSQVGSTLVFNLVTSVNNITPMASIKTDSPCYELKKIKIDVKNPFSKEADFKIILVEAKPNLQAPSPQAKKKTKQSSLKKVESKIDHGIKRKPDLKKNESLVESRDSAHKVEQMDNIEMNISAFWCPVKKICIEPYGTSSLEVQFLPFSIGHRQCSVLFLNEDVGELVYSIEAESLLPLPSSLPYQPSSHSVRVSSASAAERCRGLFGGDDRVVYWQCSVEDEIAEEILLPVINEAKEKALTIAAQQRMSEKELRRREITGSLSVATIANALQTMGLSSESLAITSPCSLAHKSETIQFAIEGNSKFFKLPKSCDITVSNNRKSDDDNARLPVGFVPEGPGHYQCRVILRAPNDVRVYHIEVTVNPEGSDIELEFTSPTHESVTQNIPVVNGSERDWTLYAKIDGEGFYGPEELYCPKQTSKSYALTFKPMYEGVVKGQLRLINTISGTETIFLLRGEGRKPLQNGHLELDCEVKQSKSYELEIPNATNRKMVFQTFCDLDFISGAPFVTVLPKQTAKFTMTLKPWRRGVFDGIISFVSDDDVTKRLGLDRTIDSDSDEDDVILPDAFRGSNSQSSIKLPDLASQKSIFKKPYRLWYSMRIVATPAPPAKAMEIECPCHNRAAIEIVVENPTKEKIEYDVFVEGPDLIPGDEVVMVQPHSSGFYQVDYAPTVVGNSRGSVIFQHPSVGEIWYDLQLAAISPPPQDLRLMQCPLGSKCHQMIRLDNPTDKNITYRVSCSNNHNFRFDFHDQKIELLPHSGVEVPLTFSPSALGLGRHKAEIVFRSEKLGDLVFIVNGSGQTPVPSDDHVIRSTLSSSSSTIISFENPFEEDIIVNVDLQERPLSKTGGILNLSRLQQTSQDQAFSLLLRQATDILLHPKTTLDIPICFAPDSMVRHEATCYVMAIKADGSSFETHGQITKFPYNREMRWVFPISGIPESCPIKDSKAPRIECKARARLEKRLELSFTGLNMNLPNYASAIHLRSLSPSEGVGPVSNFEYGTDYAFLPEDFKYWFEFGDTEAQVAVERSVGVNLVRRMSHKVSGVVTLLFNVVFAPHRSLSHLVHLIITASSGGVWRFPLRFTATEPAPDDVIQLEAAGLNKEVSIGFRLTSKSDSCVPYQVSLEASGDQMFSVTPLSGELPPSNTPGELFKVTYKPTYYGKKHISKLQIQTPDMQWVYELRGVLPTYQPPIAMSSQDMEERRLRKGNRRKKNYVRGNLDVNSTAVSSPFKGRPLVQRGKTVPTETQ
ncbi:cilia and flagella-associated protein 47-like isoform X2 [Rhopilema esculentum]|uniref:cilia and flagella-associated protein 47-like isoform X2 n=1 Tax=Rhopilema esculentum TaxID=499914 RepID=UPI0031DB3776